MYAANYGHYNILKPLVTERQAITNFREPKTDKTALMFAASNGHTRCIETLLQGKADKDLKDAQGNNAVSILSMPFLHSLSLVCPDNCSFFSPLFPNTSSALLQAYYATHYGHGNNKIIARLLSIQFPNQSYQQSGSSHSKHHHHHHQSTSAFNNSIETSNMSFQPHQERYNALIAQNQSLTEENLNYFSSNNSNTENYNNGRRFSVEINQNSLNEILNRTPQKPRPIFKSRQRRLSPNTHGHAQMMEINKERQRRHLYSLNQMNQFNHANTLNQMNNNQQTSYNQQQCNSPLNEVRNNLKNFSFDFDKNCLSGLSLNGNPSSPNAKNYSNDQIFNLQKTNSYYQMQNDSGFEPLQDSNNNDTNLSPASFKDRSKIDPNYFNVELLLNGTIDNGNLNRGRPRNSTFISNANSSGNSNHQSDSEHSSQASDDSLKDFENEERFSGFVIGIEDFLKKYELEHFVDLFVGKNIDLFTFLSLKETDLKEFGISNPGK